MTEFEFLMKIRQLRKVDRRLSEEALDRRYRWHQEKSLDNSEYLLSNQDKLILMVLINRVAQGDVFEYDYWENQCLDLPGF